MKKVIISLFSIFTILLLVLSTSASFGRITSAQATGIPPTISYANVDFTKGDATVTITNNDAVDLGLVLDFNVYDDQGYFIKDTQGNLVFFSEPITLPASSSIDLNFQVSLYTSQIDAYYAVLKDLQGNTIDTEWSGYGINPGGASTGTTTGTTTGVVGIDLMVDPQYVLSPYQNQVLNQGDPLDFNFDIDNKGSSQVKNGELGIFIYTDPQGANIVHSFIDNFVGPVDIGSFTSVSYSFDTSSLAPGIYYSRFGSDPNANLSDVNRGNDYYEITFEVRSASSVSGGGIDLLVDKQNVLNPKSGQQIPQGDLLPVTFNIRNIGADAQNVEGGIAIIDDNGNMVDSRVNIAGDIISGDSVTIFYDYDTSSLTPGKYSVRLAADPLSRLSEITINNNYQDIPFVVISPVSAIGTATSTGTSTGVGGSRISPPPSITTTVAVGTIPFAIPLGEGDAKSGFGYNLLSVPFLDNADFDQQTQDCINNNSGLWTLFYHDGNSWVKPVAGAPANVEAIFIHVPLGSSCILSGTIDTSKMPSSYSARFTSGAYNYGPVLPNLFGTKTIAASITACNADAVYGWNIAGNWTDIFNMVMDPNVNTNVYAAALLQGIAVHCT